MISLSGDLYELLELLLPVCHWKNVKTVYEVAYFTVENVLAVVH